MGRLQIRPPNLHSAPFLAQNLEDLLFDVNNLSDNGGGDDDDNKTQLAKEESKLEKEIIRTILSGKTETLKPNSGQAVTIGEHHICVGFHEETDSDYRVWEWHGHIMLFDEENGYTPEYIYGNYFERVAAIPVAVGFFIGIKMLGLRGFSQVSDNVMPELAKKSWIMYKAAAHLMWFASFYGDF
ncbi:hypothetical protein F0562_016359 [Nyssa sinensis]|uniref:Uncharacterized protein n=1 Tax=Nyssa sinensis TaxID=561372 RepID=A0A5J4ZNY7_9ASTE|nr:hypothetical protein F0562_016359 [Nyssa sinensis]